MSVNSHFKPEPGGYDCVCTAAKYSKLELHFHFKGIKAPTESQELINKLALDIFARNPVSATNAIHIHLSPEDWKNVEVELKEPDTKSQMSILYPDRRYQILLAQILGQLTELHVFPREERDRKTAAIAISTSADTKETMAKAKSDTSSPPISEEKVKELEYIKNCAAHVLGDLMIQQTGLEGGNQIFMMNFFKETLKKELSRLKLLDPKIHTGLETSINNLNSLLQKVEKGLEIEIIRLRSDPQAIKKTLNDLPVGGGAIISTGWAGEPFGHAMYMEITKESDRGPLFNVKVHNSGAGLEYHEGVQVLVADAPGRAPKLMEKRFPYIERQGVHFDDLSAPNFWKALKELQTLTEHSRGYSQYTAQDFYVKLFPRLGGTVVPASVKPEGFYITPQHSGICAWAGLSAIVKGGHPQNIASQWEYEAQVLALSELYSEFSDVNLLKGDVKACSLMRKSSEHLIAQTKLLYAQNAISLLDFEKTIDLTSKAIRQVEAAEALYEQSISSESSKRFQLGYQYYDAYGYLDKQKTQNIQAISEIIRKPTTLFWDPRWTPSPDKIAQDLKTFRETYAKSIVQEPLETARCIRELFLKIPAPKRKDDPFWTAEMSPKDMESCMESIADLSEILFQACEENKADANPEKRIDFIICLSKGLAIQHKLASFDKELQSYGIDSWGIGDILTNCFDLGSKDSGGRGQFYEQQIREQFAAVHEYVGNIGKLDFFEHHLKVEPTSAIECKGIPSDELSFIYIYYLQNKEKFKKCFGNDFDEATLKMMFSEPELIKAKANYSLLDKAGNYFPKAYCLLKKQAVLQSLFSIGKSRKCTTALIKTGQDNLEKLRHITSLNSRNDVPKPFKSSDKWHHAHDYVKDISLAGIRHPPYGDLNANIKRISSCAEDEYAEIKSLRVKATIEGGFEPQELQITKAIDYFSIHLDKLSDHDLQIYMRDIIFEKDYLKTILIRSPEFAGRFITFIQEGYLHFRARKDIPSASYMIYLAQMFNDALQPILKEDHLLNTAWEHLQKTGIDPEQHFNTEQCLKDMLMQCDSLEMKAVVHRQLVFEYLLQIPRLSIFEIHKKLFEIVPSLGVLQGTSVPTQYTNTHLDYAKEKLRMAILPHLKHYKTDTRHDAISVFALVISRAQDLETKEQYVEWKKVNWKSEPPFFIGSVNEKEVCVLDIQEQALVLTGQGSQPLPALILENATFKTHFPEIKHCRCKTNGRGFYEFFDSQGGVVRIWREKSDTLIIQRQFEKNGRWYQYEPDYYKIPSKLNCKSLRENKSYWNACDGSGEVVICKTGSSKISYRLIPKENRDHFTFDLIDEFHPHRCLKRYPNIAPNFEIDEHTNAWMNSKTRLIELIEMPRLGLNFKPEIDLQKLKIKTNQFVKKLKEASKQSDDTLSTAFFLNDHIKAGLQTSLKLDRDFVQDAEYLQSAIKTMLVKRESSEKDVKEARSAIPTSDLLMKDNKGNVKFKSDQATGFHIAEYQYVKALGDFANYLVLENDKGQRKIIIPRKEIWVIGKGGLNPLFRLTNDFPVSRGSQLPPYFEYTLNKKGVLESPHEAANLHLAYILLAQRRYKEAQTYLLDRAHKNKKYSARDAEQFQWIHKLETEALDNDPRSSAVYLTAIALLWKNQQIHGKHLTDPLADPKCLKKIVKEYDNYLSLQEYMGDVLLPPEMELVLVKELAKKVPDNRAVQARLSILTETAASGLSHRSSVQPVPVPSPEKPDKDMMVRDLRHYVWIDESKHKVATSQSEKTTPKQPEPDPLLTRPFSSNHIEEDYNRALSIKPEERQSFITDLAIKGAFKAYKPLYDFLTAVALDTTKSFPTYKELTETIWRVREEKKNDLGIAYLTDLAQKACDILKKAQPAKPQEMDIKKEFSETQEKVKQSVYSPRVPKDFKAQPAIPGIGALASLGVPESSEDVVKNLFTTAINPKTEASRKNAELLKAELLKKEKDVKVEKEKPSAQVILRESLPALEQEALKKLCDDIGKFQNRLPATSLKLNFTDDRQKLLDNLASSKQTIEKRQFAIHAAAEKMQSELLQLANQKPALEGSSEEVRKALAKHEAELISGQKSPFTVDDLCVAFLRNNVDEIKERNPFLTDHFIVILRGLLSSYLVHATHEQHLIRQEEALLNMSQYIEKQLPNHNFSTDLSLQELSIKATEELTARREYDPTKNLNFLIYEKMSGLMLKPEQAENLNKLTNSSHMILQMIMGSGKSKVLLPILGLANADGDTLSMVILPASLYESTTQDLRQNMGSAFNRAVHTRQFDRNTDFTVENLQNLTDYLQEIRKKKECLIMSSKSAACLLLKFIEAFDEFSKNPANDELRHKVQLMQGILKLFKEKTKAIIDEADLILNARLEVNFTLGEKQPIDKERCRQISDLYLMLQNPEIRKILGSDPMDDFSMPLDKYHREIKPRLRDFALAALVSKEPYGKYLKSISEENRKLIHAYLSGEGTEAAEKFVKASPHGDTFALIKEELNNILPLTLNKRYCVDFGPSQKKGSFLRALAIPYIGNNVPVESSEFRSPDIIMNNTIQSCWKSGIKLEHMEQLIAQLKTESTREKILSGLDNEEETAANKAFREMCGPKLKHLKLPGCSKADCQIIIDSLNAARKDDPKRFLDFVSDQILTRIQVYPEQITSTAIDFAGIFKSIIGFTGTPWNSETFAEPLRKATQKAEGTDGQTAVPLYEMASAPNGIRTLKGTGFPNVLSELIRPEDDALIDCASVFNGQDNEKVSQAILKLLQSRSSQKKGVVFYQKGKQVVLESLEGGKTQIVPLGECSLRPEHRFTYYDQPHTTGADIEQPLLANGTLTLGKDNTFRDWCQGARRYRGLDKGQRLSFALTPQFDEKARNKYALAAADPIKARHLVKVTSANQVEQEVSHLNLSTIQKIDSAPKRFVLDKLIDADVSSAKAGETAAQLFKDSRHILINKQNYSPLANYGDQEKPVPKEDVIKSLIIQAKEKFEYKYEENKLVTINPSSPLYSGNKNETMSKVFKQIDAGLGDTVKRLPAKMSSHMLSNKNSDGEVEKLQVREQQPFAHREAEMLAEISSHNLKGLPSQNTNPWWHLSSEPPPLFSRILYSHCLWEGGKDFLKEPQLMVNYLKNDKRDRIPVFQLQLLMKEQRNVEKRKFAPLAGMLTVSSNRNPMHVAARDAYSLYKRPQLPMEYYLFIRDKKDGSIKCQPLDSENDLNYFWVALSLARKNKYAFKGEKEVELCICNYKGEILQHDGQTNIEDPKSPFMKDLKEKGPAWRAVAKIWSGELFFSKEEQPYVKKMIADKGKKLVADYYREVIFPDSPRKLGLFKHSPLYEWLDKPDWVPETIKKTLQSKQSNSQTLFY